MFCKNLEQARKAAQANANQTGVNWVVFIDTSGNCRCERQLGRPKPGSSWSGSDSELDEVFAPQSGDKP